MRVEVSPSVQVSEHFCPDGLVFDETSTAYAKCGFPFAVDCSGKRRGEVGERLVIFN